jgi:hypothetical protein
MSSAALIIEPRFNGPPDSANGGYTCGLLAQALPGIVEVTLRQPPPLGKPLVVVRADGSATLSDGDQVIAEVRRIEPLELTPPPAPTASEASACASRYVGFQSHNYPTCFVCGPQRAVGDGLRIFPGPCDGHGHVACTWTPDATLCDASGFAGVPLVWAALDCPGYFGAAEPGEPAVLGRMAVDLRQAPRVGDTCIIAGWSLGREGRKIHAATALYAEDGRLHAIAKQTWIKLTAAD